MNTPMTSDLVRKSDAKSPWPRVIILSFILLAIFDGYIVKQALSTRVSGVTENPYEDSLNYEKLVEGKRAASRAGISMKINSDRPKMQVIFDGLSLTKRYTLKLSILKPDNAKLDRNFTVESDSGTFPIDISGLKPGLWLVQATLNSSSDENEHFYFETKTMLN